MILDNDIQGLREAKYLYEHRQYMDKDVLYNAVVSLNEYQLFTVGQLSQLSGLSDSTIAGWGIKMPRKGGGKFNPQSLDTLIQLRLNLNNGRPLNAVLLASAVQDGNSHRIISRLTGVGLSRISKVISKHATDSGTDLQ